MIRLKRAYEAAAADDGRPEEVAQLVGMCREGTVTFVYGSRDERHNAAVVLKEYVEERLEEQGAGAPQG